MITFEQLETDSYDEVSRAFVGIEAQFAEEGQREVVCNSYFFSRSEGDVGHVQFVGIFTFPGGESGFYGEVNVFHAERVGEFAVARPGTAAVFAVVIARKDGVPRYGQGELIVERISGSDFKRMSAAVRTVVEVVEWLFGCLGEVVGEVQFQTFVLVFEGEVYFVVLVAELGRAPGRKGESAHTDAQCGLYGGITALHAAPYVAADEVGVEEYFLCRCEERAQYE